MGPSDSPSPSPSPVAGTAVIPPGDGTEPEDDAVVAAKKQQKDPLKHEKQN